ncbi:hypothetical protein I0C86_30905 [Plantactinospora sp. S1510]|uniref:Uncharacterized protein n=1 Tax=Plantactinospora alkalitolerans TaxID=2789879 RepID=A0ABS0H4F1_9ACTN|nr:hypothetical protein [Plantactinospora alkalitolerans]MBF9133338.1 hypothetical protein [Plantactinospora alkalitolerans]
MSSSRLMPSGPLGRSGGPAGKAANMLTLAREKAQRVAAKKTKSAPAPGLRAATIKVGR